MALGSRPAPSPAALAREGLITSVWCDIDDTLTDAGRIGAQAFAAMWALHDAGVHVIPVTGRPAGWCDMVARQWPVFGVVGENGALFYRFDGARRRLERRYAEGAERPDLSGILMELARDVPEARVASDQAFRLFDLAIDFAEDVGPLGSDRVEALLALFERHGARAKVSSIHVNGWWGEWDKMQMIRRTMEAYELAGAEAVYIGDSPNDQPAFAGFSRSVGVANVRDFEWAEGTGPRWICRGRGGQGFAELAEAVLAANENLPPSKRLR